MNTLHFDNSLDSLYKLEHLFSTYGWSHTIFDDLNASRFLVRLLASRCITVTEVPYDFDYDIASTDPEIEAVYHAVSQDIMWRWTSPDTVRMHALRLLEEYGTPTVAEAKYFLYEDSHIAAYAGNEDASCLIGFLSRHPDVEKWILFPSPGHQHFEYDHGEYYVFHLTPSARSLMTKFYDLVLEDERMQISEISRRMEEEKARREADRLIHDEGPGGES